MVATPTPVDRNPNLVQMALAMPPMPPRADLLVLVEHKGRTATLTGASADRTGQAQPQSYRGRY
jgi:hypothetical protein